jgi:hypothetical protein
VTTCDQADYDTRLAAYSECVSSSLVGCNDDGPGCSGFTSIMVFDVSFGSTYLIRVGGFGGSGSGTLTISCSTECPGFCTGDLNGDALVDGADLGLLLGSWSTANPCVDLSGDGTVDGADLGILLGAWGPCGLSCGAPTAGDCEEANGTPYCEDEACCNSICAVDPFCCDTEWDQACADAAIADVICQGAPIGCGPDTGDCCTANGTPGCDDADCCTAVCIADSFCCDVEWDDVCAESACGTNGLCPGQSCPDNPACPGDGACDVGNGSPGCDDETCCNCVCGLDPFCCDVEWDDICADEALAEPACDFSTPPACGEPGTGSCCVDNGSPFCDDLECCEAVCAVDHFCCDVAWDGICADQAVDLCPGCTGGGPPNDSCDNAIKIFDGETPFSTIGATTSAGFELPPECDEGFGLDFVDDIWFLYSPTCSGTLTISTCDAADYDTRLAAYSDCLPDFFLGCNDDGPGCSGFTSILEIPVGAAQPVFIRVGGFGGSGTGVLTLTCE